MRKINVVILMAKALQLHVSVQDTKLVHVIRIELSRMMVTYVHLNFSIAK